MVVNDDQRDSCRTLLRRGSREGLAATRQHAAGTPGTNLIGRIPFMDCVYAKPPGLISGPSNPNALATIQ
jgi:hypothetical protein